MKALKNDLMELLKYEFKSAAAQKRQFKFDFNFAGPLNKLLITSSSVWTPTKCYISSESFTLNKLECIDEATRQQHYFLSGLQKVNRYEIW